MAKIGSRTLVASTAVSSLVLWPESSLQTNFAVHKQFVNASFKNSTAVQICQGTRCNVEYRNCSLAYFQLEINLQSFFVVVVVGGCTSNGKNQDCTCLLLIMEDKTTALTFFLTHFHFLSFLSS